MNEFLALSDEEIKRALCPSPITPDAWSFSGKDLREAIMGDRLLNVSIDLSNACNLNCPYCFTAPINSAKREKKTDELSFDEYKEMMLRLHEAGTRTINIIGEGEPTMYPFFDQLVEFISKLGMKVLVSTNGILLANQGKRLDLLNEVKATIVLKVNSRDRYMQDILVGRKGYAALRDKALRKLINAGFNKDNPTRLAINTLLIDSVFAELYDLFLFCRSNNIAFLASVYMPTGRTSGISFHGQEALPQGMKDISDLYKPLDADEIGALLKQIQLYDSEHSVPRAPFPAYISGIACTQLLGVQIDNQGKVWCCPARLTLNQDGAQESRYLADKTVDLRTIWQDEPFLTRMRDDYNGSCIFKQTHQKY